MAPLKLSREDHSVIVRPDDILSEVKEILLLIYGDFDFNLINTVYHDIVKLFNGEYVGYRKCNTGYHDLRHTEECLLDMTRIIHGAWLNGYHFSEKDINLGLISAIMHDTGYIQTIDDTVGTGGKFTPIHIDRSIEFMKKYLLQQGFSLRDFKFCENCLKCTGLNVSIKEIRFLSCENEILGKILGTADLIGQMADPSYLAKLPILYQEFREGGITAYENEFDLLKKTPGFWQFTQDRFTNELGGVDRFLRDHFRVRWGVDRDLERETIERNIQELTFILENHPTDYHRHLSPPQVHTGIDLAYPGP